MSVEADFVALLLADPGVAALVGDRVAMTAVPDGSLLPLVVFTSSHAPTHGLLGTVLADEVTLLVQCWATNAVDAAALADAVDAALAGAPATAGAVVADRQSIFEEQTGLDGVALTVSYWA